MYLRGLNGVGVLEEAGQVCFGSTVAAMIKDKAKVRGFKTHVFTPDIQDTTTLN